MPRPRGRRAYNRVAGDDDAASESESDNGSLTVPPKDEATDDEDDHFSLDTRFTIDDEDEEEEEDDGERITIIVMDPAQTRFELSVNPKWTISKVKQHGFAVHKVPASSQRLIYRGRMLADEMTLAEAGIDQEKVIVHLFPKPRVVVASEHGSRAPEDDDRAEEGGAHVPRIVLDPDEAEMRSSILVLGSAEIIEAQNNVKLLSFLLLIICSMELLALFTIMLGVPTDSSSLPDGGAGNGTIPPPPPFPTDDDGFVTPGSGVEVRTWRNSDYFDLVLSSFGFYVATLGIKVRCCCRMPVAARERSATAPFHESV